MNFRKKSLCWFLCLSLVMFLTVSWVNQASSAGEETASSGQGKTEVKASGEKAGDTVTTDKKDEEKKKKEGEEQNKKKTGIPWIVFLYALMLTLFILIPTLTDILKAYKAQNANWTLIIEKLIDKAGKEKLDKDQLKALIDATSAGPPGISGMSRSLMAFAVIIILGIAVFHLLATTGDTETVKNAMSMLGATLASITGFYFGGRSAEQKATSGQPGGGGPGGQSGTGTGTETETAADKSRPTRLHR